MEGPGASRLPRTTGTCLPRLGTSSDSAVVPSLPYLRRPMHTAAHHKVGPERQIAGEIARVEFSNFEMRGVVARRRVAFFGPRSFRDGARQRIPTGRAQSDGIATRRSTTSSPVCRCSRRVGCDFGRTSRCVRNGPRQRRFGGRARDSPRTAFRVRDDGSRASGLRAQHCAGEQPALLDDVSDPAGPGARHRLNIFRPKRRDMHQPVV
jgi:hypothetical protein